MGQTRGGLTAVKAVHDDDARSVSDGLGERDGKVIPVD